MKSLLIVGCGDVARRAIPWLKQRFRVVAVVRREESAAALRALGVRVIQADLDQPRSLPRLAALADYVLHCAPPQDRGDDDLRTKRLCAALGRRKILSQGVVYISTSGVYGDCAGALVDETRPARPRSPRGQRRLAAEQRMRAFGRTHASHASILRAPGIYAAERLPLARLQRGDPVLCRDEDVHTNHIHADDLARLACLALFRGRAGRVFNASDNSMLRMGDYFDLVADHFALPRPPRLPRAQIAQHLSPLTLSFMAESRRLDNRRMGRELRVRLRYPDVAATLATLPVSQEEFHAC